MNHPPNLVRRRLLQAGLVATLPAGLLSCAKDEDAPLVVGGVMYISNQIGQVEARDPATGKVIWREANFPGDGPLTALRSSRGLAISGEGASARIITVRGSYLYQLDAKTGAVITSFGDKGRVDLGTTPRAASTIGARPIRSWSRTSS